jgi:light-regulated signal transduction histidine kinase (bacteriophytochrome)
LIRLNEDLGQFTFAATHDLREPLRSVAIFAQMLQVKAGDMLDVEAKEYVTKIVRGAERMARLIDGLLEFTYTAESGMAHSRGAEAGQALDHALENLQISMGESMAEVTQDPLPAVLAGLRHVSLVFQNLVGNSIKYQRPGVTPKVHISAQADTSHWIFAVRDNGIGIAAEDLDKIFIPFKRLHGREIACAGIGLATCKRIVERYKGRMWVESAPEIGSTFYFSLPGAKSETHGD